MVIKQHKLHCSIFTRCIFSRAQLEREYSSVIQTTVTSPALKHIVQKEGRLTSYVNGGYVCKSWRKCYGYILKVSEAHGSIIILLY